MILRLFVIHLIAVMYVLQLQAGDCSSSHEPLQTDPLQTDPLQTDPLQTNWSGGEHKQLGDLGFQKACAESNHSLQVCQLNQIARADGKIKLSYGQIVAFGDFYMAPEKAYVETKRVGSIQKIFKCIDKEGRVHETQSEKPEAQYPDCTWVNVLFGGDYLNVVSNNEDHFVWDNMKAYVQFHSQALNLAAQAFQAKKRGQAVLQETLLNKALFYNAFADHFLTDAFAAGHLRVPRRQIKIWAKAKFAGLLHSFIGDSLSLLLHDNEGKNALNQEVGMQVKNSLGHQWTTPSDSFLNVCANEEELQIRLPTMAVQASVGEVLMALQTGIVKTESYQATWFVPYPTEAGIVDRWNQLLLTEGGEARIGKLLEQLPQPLRWLVSLKQIKKLIFDLPNVIGQFSNQVDKDLAENPKLRQLLPARYIEQVRKLN